MLKAPSSDGLAPGLISFSACFLFIVINLWTDKAIMERGELSTASSCVLHPLFPGSLLVKFEG